VENVVVALLVALVLGLALCAWWVRREYLAIRAEIADNVAGLFAPGPDGAPSPVQGFVAAMAAAIGGELKQSLSGALMGHASAISKQMAAIEGEGALEVAEGGSPVLGLLTALSPALRKRLSKSPMASIAASMLANRFGGLGTAQGGADNGHGTSRPSGGGLNVP